MKISSIVLVIGIWYSCASRTDSINSSVTCKYANGMYDRVLIYTTNPTLTDHTPNTSYYIYLVQRNAHTRTYNGHICNMYVPITQKAIHVTIKKTKKQNKKNRKPPTLSLTYPMNINKK